MDVVPTVAVLVVATFCIDPGVLLAPTMIFVATIAAVGAGLVDVGFVTLVLTPVVGCVARAAAVDIVTD